MDNIDDENTTALLKKEIKNLRDRKILCVTKDKDNPVYDDRLRSFQHQNLVSKRNDNSQHIYQVQFAESGYFIQDRNLRCCGCSFNISIDEYDNLATQKKDTTSLDSKQCLESINAKHEQYSSVFKKRF